MCKNFMTFLVPWLFSGYYVHTVESVTGKRRRMNNITQL